MLDYATIWKQSKLIVLIVFQSYFLDNHYVNFFFILSMQDTPLLIECLDFNTSGNHELIG